MFAFCAIPAIGAVGVAVDYARALQVKAVLTSLADQAALEAVQFASASASRGATESDRTAAVSQAINGFNARVGALRMASIAPPAIALAYAGGTLTAEVNYAAAMGTSLTAVFGISSLNIGGTASATTSSTKTYVDIYFLLDVSTSMGIGATVADQATLQAATGCAVACHVYNTSAQGTFDAARRSGAKLRIDVVKDAVKSVLSQASAALGSDVRVSISTFSNSIVSTLPITGDLASARTFVSGIDLTGAQYQSGTNFHTTLADLAATVPTSGDGSSAKSRKVFLLLMTDGIEDPSSSYVNVADTQAYAAWAAANYPSGKWKYHGKDQTGAPNSSCRGQSVQYCTGAWQMDQSWTSFAPFFDWAKDRANPNRPWMAIQGFDSTLCSPFKSKGIQVVTLNTEYLIPANEMEQRFTFIGNTLKPNIAAQMRACASSPDDAFSASSAQDISDAVSLMILRAVPSTPRLSK
jgi:hypothetical protein